MTTIPSISANQARCWYVYELVDARTNASFYIGMTKDPVTRFAAHQANPKSAAFLRIKEIVRSGSCVKMSIVGRHETKGECLAHEAELIRKTEGIVNIHVPGEERRREPPGRPVIFRTKTQPPTLSYRTPFAGVIMAADAAEMWRKLGSAERRILCDLAKMGCPVKRRRDEYPIKWSYWVSGKETFCRGKILEKLRLKGLVKFGNSPASEYSVSPLGTFVARQYNAKDQNQVARAA